jgi:OOP family OmpA-OmpF porin
MNKSLLLLTIISASYATLATAQDQEYYAGLAIGRSSADVTEISRQDVLDTGFTSISGFQSGSSKSDTAWKIFGGYRLNPNVAAELFYANLGKFSREASGTGVTTFSSTLDFALNSNLKITGFGAAVLVGLPLTEQLSAFAKPGLIYWMAKRTDSTTAGTATQNKSTDKNGTSPSLGVGISYAFTDKLSARLEGERFFDIGDKNTTGKSNIDLLAFSIQFAP